MMCVVNYFDMCYRCICKEKAISNKSVDFECHRKERGKSTQKFMSKRQKLY